MTLVAGRLLLRPMSDDRARHVAAGRIDDAAPGYPRDDDLVVAALVVDGHMSAGAWGSWEIVRRSDHRVVGTAGFKGAPSSDGCVEIGYGLVPSARGSGLATEAVASLVGWARRRRARQVVAECDPANLPSRAVLEKCGFTLVESSDDVTRWRRTLDDGQHGVVQRGAAGD